MKCIRNKVQFIRVESDIIKQHRKTNRLICWITTILINKKKEVLIVKNKLYDRFYQKKIIFNISAWNESVKDVHYGLNKIKFI